MGRKLQEKLVMKLRTPGDVIQAKQLVLVIHEPCQVVLLVELQSSLEKELYPKKSDWLVSKSKKYHQ